MKTFSSVILLMAIASLTFTSCSKEDVSGSSWTFNGISYNGAATFFTGGILGSADDATTDDNNSIAVFFDGTPTAGTYTVVGTSSLGASECGITVTPKTSDSYFSTGEAGDKVTVTVNGGKITASFSNISVAMISSPDIKTVSGTLVQQ